MISTMIDNVNNYSKLEIPNNTTRHNKTTEEQLVETIIENHAQHASNNKPCAFTSFDAIDYEHKEIKKVILWNKVKIGLLKLSVLSLVCLYLIMLMDLLEDVLRVCFFH